MSQLRIAFIFPKYPPCPDGGADYLESLAHELACMGHHVGIFTSSSAGAHAASRAYARGSLEVFPCVEDWRAPFLSKSSSWLIFKKKLHQFQPDVIELLFPDSTIKNDYQLPFLLPSARIAPLNVLFFSLFISDSNWIGKIVVIQLLLSSKRIIVHTQQLESTIQRYLPFLAKKVRLIPVGDNMAAHTLEQHSDLDLSVPKETRRRLGIPDDVFVVGFYGSVDPSKGIEDLLSALEHLAQQGEEFRCLFIGGRYKETPYYDLVERMKAESSIHSWIISTGYIEGSKVIESLLACDVVALPFRKNVLGRSSLVTSLSLGLPVITTRSPQETSYLVHSKNVYLCQSGDSDSLAQAILTLKNDKDLRQRLSQGALIVAKEFSWKIIAQKTLITLQEG